MDTSPTSSAATPQSPEGQPLRDVGMTGSSTPSCQQESPDTSDPAAVPQFSPAACLFCTTRSIDTAANLSHMRRAHGLLVPSPEHLVVDVETLLGYLHVVIFELGECIVCHTARRTPAAVQQHMRGKGHCRIDLESEGAEMLEFYDLGNGDEDGGSLSSSSLSPSRDARLQKVDWRGEDTERSRMALSSGRAALPRTAHINGRYPRTAEGPLPSTTTSGQRHESVTASYHAGEEGEANGTVSTRQSRLHHAVEHRLSNLRASDRSSIAHMSRPEQLSTLAVAQRQLEQSRRAERRARGRLERMNNSTMMKHFVSDVPGPKLG
ncbi:C2H2 type zinc-finger-domain-containing protein [Microdochium bolleyi]|uniref:C2H2 type zinc-finger-domain-containing protein n=1 Tax=Microdochium bolleyi TaxID=196109 RepID=A0A136J0I6_9PEZI|nr:C2H2 type zinc-finger-domain-containing protein [Microdochium bolleyi]